MKRNLLSIIIIIYFSGSLFSQVLKFDCESLDTLILWDKEDLLIWNDYLGKPDLSKEELSFADAVSAISFYFDFYEDVKHNINFVSFAYFKKNGSWVKADSSIQLLNHERTHFDIAELFVRKVRKKIDKLKEEGINDKNIYYKNILALKNEYDSLNVVYDKETMYGSFDRFQEEWSCKIKKELELLDAYAADYYSIYFSGCDPH